MLELGEWLAWGAYQEAERLPTVALPGKVLFLIGAADIKGKVFVKPTKG